MLTYYGFLQNKIDLSPVGLNSRGENHPYFCTPKGARVIGWAGVDGIHYCFVRGFADMVFAVSPMNAGDYVHPIARSFEDLLRLLLSCGDMAAIEQCYAWDEEQFKAFLLDNPATQEQQTVLNTIRDVFGLAPMEDAFSYVKTLQGEFDLSRIPYTDDYYDLDMNPAAPKRPPEWKVYFDGNFWGHSKGQRPGTEIPIGKEFEWAGYHWVIPAAYACSKGLVIDFCMRVEPRAIQQFMEKWDLTPENEASRHFSDEERMRLDADNPLCFNFNAAVRLNGKDMRTTHGCAVAYNPTQAIFSSELEGQWVVDHYGLDSRFAWVIQRSCYPWATKRKPEIKTLSVTMFQQPMSIPGPHFQVQKPGDTFQFSHGQDYILTVQEYETQVVDTGSLWGKDMDFPTYHYVMSYTVTPELPEETLSIQDCVESDRPRRKEENPYEAVAVIGADDAAAIGIIGGADGPTAIVYGYGHQSNKLHAACSALHFEPVEEVQWRMVFHETQFKAHTTVLIEKQNRNF